MLFLWRTLKELRFIKDSNSFFSHESPFKSQITEAPRVKRRGDTGTLNRFSFNFYYLVNYV